VTPKISIVIPAFNSEKFLTYTIESVVCQSFTDWELVLVDDGSTDSTVSIMQSFVSSDSRIRMISQANAGVSRARNAGLASTSDTPYVIFLDADDTWEPEALEVLHATLEANTDFVGAYGLGTHMDHTGKPFRTGQLEGSQRTRASYKSGRVVSLEPDEPTSFYTLLVSCCIPTPGLLMLRRHAIEISGSFDESLTHCEDADYYFRLTRHGSFKFVERIILNYRKHPENHSSNKPKMTASRHTILSKVSNSVEFTPEQRAAAANSYSAVQRHFAGQKLDYCRRSVREGNWKEGAKQLKYATGYLARMVVAKADRYSRRSA